jgi:hypothetical protein
LKVKNASMFDDVASIEFERLAVEAGRQAR